MVDKEKKERWSAVDIPTEIKSVIVDNEAKEGETKQYDIYAILARLSNKLDKIEKNLG